MCTTIIALVFEVIFLLMSSGSMLKVSLQTSAYTGIAFAWVTAYPHIATVKAGIITSSPSPTPKASNAACSVDVPELKPIPYFWLCFLAKACSNLSVNAPVSLAPKPFDKTSETYCASLVSNLQPLFILFSIYI